MFQAALPLQGSSMPQPARHDQLPRLTRLINWESLDSTTDGPEADATSTASNNNGLPTLGTDSLPLPRGTLQARNCVEACSDDIDGSLGYRPMQYAAGVSNTNTNTIPPQGPLHDGSTGDRLQQGLHALHSVGFPSVDAFALEYYTSRLGPSPEASLVEQRRGLSTLGHLVMVLQNASSRADPVEAAGLHNGIATAARDLYISELRGLGYIPYNPEEAEHQVSRQPAHTQASIGTADRTHLQLPHLYRLLYDLLTHVGCRPDLVDATVRNSIQGLWKSSFAA